MDQTRTLFTSQHVNPKNPKRKQYVEYRNYKLFEKNKSHVLEMSGDQDELESLTIEQLLQAYADVEKMYTLRDIYRKKYFTPEQWDGGHEQRFTYLISVMDIYRDQLKHKFRDELKKQVEMKREVEHSEAAKQQPQKPKVEIYELGSLIQKIDKDIQQKTQEEVDIWNSIIPQMINERRVVLEEKKQIFESFRKLFYDTLVKDDAKQEKYFSFDEAMFCITYVGAKFANRGLPRDNVKITLTVDEFIIESPYFKDAQGIKEILVKTRNKLENDPGFKDELQGKFKFYRFRNKFKELSLDDQESVLGKIMSGLSPERQENVGARIQRLEDYRKKIGKR